MTEEENTTLETTTNENEIIFESNQQIDPNNIVVDVDETYPFTLTTSTFPDYRMASSISTWLTNNLASLTDDNDNVIFSKVNNGFNENSLKTFGVKPTCDVYINNIEYDVDFDCTKPNILHSIIIFYIKGANNNAYAKACELHDYIMQEFIENDSFKILDGIVSNTFITNSELMNQPVNKKWGVMGAFELSHILF